MDMGLRYTNTKIFNFKEKIDSLPEDVDRIAAPIHIRMKPTNVCNHKCSYCSYRMDNVQLGKDMSVRDLIPREKMMEITEDIIDMGVKSVTFSGGGEPLCYPHLTEAVKRLSRSSVKFAVLTNGSKLEGEIAEILACRATWLRVSMDGWDDESYSSYRGVRIGAFAQVIRNMEDFKKKAGKCHLGVSLVVDRKNALHVRDFIQKLAAIGVNSIKISPCIVSNEISESNEYHRQMFSQVKDQIQSAIDDLKGQALEIFDAYHELDEKFSKEYSWCPYLQVLPVIGADQNVYSCQDKAYNLEEGLIGSIKETRFRDFWYNDKSKFFRINPSVHCRHHCVSNAKNRLMLDYLNADKGHLEFV